MDTNLRRSIRAAALLVALVLCIPTAAGAGSSSTIGTNPHLSIGTQALLVGDYEAGIEHMLAGLKEELAASRRTFALSNLCAGYVGAQRYAEAVEACTQAIELRQTNWRAFNNRALAYLFQGNFPAARADLAAGLALNPDSGHLHKVQAMLQQRDPVMLAEGD